LGGVLNKILLKYLKVLEALLNYSLSLIVPEKKHTSLMKALYSLQSKALRNSNIYTFS